MNILAFSDFHDNKSALRKVKEKLNEADIVICHGDLTNWGRNLEKVVEEICSWGKTTLFLHGNHENEKSMRRIVENYKNARFLHMASYRAGKYLIFGYGGGGFATTEEPFEKVSEKFAGEIKRDDIVVMVSHGPPYGNKVDNLKDLGHRGCKSYTKFIEKYKPMLWICGHLHETFGVIDVKGKTVIANPGPEGRIFKIH